MWAKRRILPSLDAVDSLSAEVFIRAGDEVDQNLLDLLDISVLEGPHLPEALRRRAVTVIGGVEEIVEPFLSLRKALILAQVNCDSQRHVEEQLPVID